MINSFPLCVIKYEYRKNNAIINFEFIHRPLPTKNHYESLRVSNTNSMRKQAVNNCHSKVFIRIEACLRINFFINVRRPSPVFIRRSGYGMESIGERSSPGTPILLHKSFDRCAGVCLGYSNRRRANERSHSIFLPLPFMQAVDEFKACISRL